MDSKDAQESLESGGGGARCRCSNGRRNAAVVLLMQSILTVACAAFSLTIFLNQQEQKERGIFMQMLNSDTEERKFLAIWNQSVYLNNEKRVNLSCAGPYVVYLWAYFEGLNGESANLTMEQGSNSFHLQTLQDKTSYKEQRIFLLSDREEVTLKVRDFKKIQTIKVFLGLHYMLGAQCFQDPL